MPAISDGGKRYTIPIRSGMTFANGQPVTAKDFVYTFSRICDPATKSPAVSHWDPGKGCSAFSKHPVGSVSGIKALSPHSLQITLTQPDAAFKYVLAMPQASVIPAGTGARQAKHPLGVTVLLTGPADRFEVDEQGEHHSGLTEERLLEVARGQV